MINTKGIKFILTYDREFISSKVYCKCEQKIIDEPYDDNVVHCELCGYPILLEDRDEVVDDWRHMNLSKEQLCEIYPCLN